MLWHNRTTTLTLVETQATHKQTSFNLQRAQSALQFARQTAQNEIKRKDKEIERIQERWVKVVNDQPKSALAVGMRCANLAAGSASVVPKARQNKMVFISHTEAFSISGFITLGSVTRTNE